MPKVHHRFIRINGKIKKSPPFKRAMDADRWYSEELRKKQHLQSGLSMPLDVRTSLNVYFDQTWLPLRKSEYTKATWGSDEQRYRDYVRPTLGNFKVAKINALQIRHCLNAVTQKHGQSTGTRNKVRSLLSKIFGDAMLEEKPLRVDNPALGIKFKDPRMGTKKPAHISREPDILLYLKAARSFDFQVFVMASTFLMSALRKSELIPRVWSNYDQESKDIVVNSRFVQAEKKIMAGTKAGREQERVVNIPDSLVALLDEWKLKTRFNDKHDFIFCDDKGEMWKPRQINVMLEMVAEKSGVKASPHALRHSFGRWFVAKGGGLKALQTIMGHSNYKTTELYSELVAEQVKKERNRVSFEVEK